MNDLPRHVQPLRFVALPWPWSCRQAGGRPARLLMLAAALVASGAAQAAPPASAAPLTPIVIADDGCTPSRLDLAEGAHAFAVSNRRTTESKWKILRGAHTIAGSDAIAPGATQAIAAQLDEGRYRILCGRPEDPKGRLVVTEAVPPGALDPQVLAGTVAAYAGYVHGELDALRNGAEALATAAAAGDLARARALYAPTRVHYEHIQPAAELFHDVDRALDARAADFPGGADDPAFAGLHRIEYLLFARADARAAAPYARRLAGSVAELRGFFDDVGITPRQIVDGASNLIENAAQSTIAGEDDRYSGADLWNLQAKADGARRIVALLRPQLASADPALLAAIGQRLDETDAQLAAYRRGDGFAAYAALSPADRDRLKGTLDLLAEDLGRLRAALHLN